MAGCEWLQQWKRNKKVAGSYPRLGAGVSNLVFSRPVNKDGYIKARYLGNLPFLPVRPLWWIQHVVLWMRGD